jgi:hypothetical protein
LHPRETEPFSAAIVLAGSLALELRSRAVVPTIRFAANSYDRPAPAWRNDSWLNTPTPLKLEDLRGKVVLLNFWVFTCYNCTNTLPSLADFDCRYREKGLVSDRHSYS